MNRRRVCSLPLESSPEMIDCILVAVALMRLLVQLVPKNMAAGMPFLAGVGLNAHTAAFAAAVVLLATLLLAVTPMLRLSFQQLRAGLTDGDRGATGQLWRRLGANLVIFELAIAVMLLAGAGLLGAALSASARAAGI